MGSFATMDGPSSHVPTYERRDPKPISPPSHHNLDSLTSQTKKHPGLPEPPHGYSNPLNRANSLLLRQECDPRVISLAVSCTHDLIILHHPDLWHKIQLYWSLREVPSATYVPAKGPIPRDSEIEYSIKYRDHNAGECRVPEPQTPPKKHHLTPHSLRWLLADKS